MKKYGYIDKGGLLKVSESEKDARQYAANGKIAETEIETRQAYPTLNGRTVYCYGVGKAYWDNRQTYGEVIPLQSYPALLGVYTLYEKLA